MRRRSLEIEITDIPRADALWNMPADAQLRLEIDDDDPELPPIVTTWYVIDNDANDIELSEEERAWFDDQFSRVTWPRWVSRPYEAAVRRSAERAEERRAGL